MDIKFQANFYFLDFLNLELKFFLTKSHFHFKFFQWSIFVKFLKFSEIVNYSFLVYQTLYLQFRSLNLIQIILLRSFEVILMDLVNFQRWFLILHQIIMSKHQMDYVILWIHRLHSKQPRQQLILLTVSYAPPISLECTYQRLLLPRLLHPLLLQSPN